MKKQGTLGFVATASAALPVSKVLQDMADRADKPMSEMTVADWANLAGKIEADGQRRKPAKAKRCNASTMFAGKRIRCDHVAGHNSTSADHPGHWHAFPHNPIGMAWRTSPKGRRR